MERLQEGGRRAYVYAYVGDGAGGSVSERQEGRGRFNNELTCSRSYPWTSDRDLWRAGAPSSPRLASSLQPKAIFPKISERTLWALLGAAGGLLAARPGGLGARESRLDSGRDTRPPASTAARSRCAFTAFSVPSDGNRSPRRRPRGCYLGRSGPGEAVEALRRLDGIHQGTRDQSEQSTSPDPRGPWTHHLHPGVAAGAGKGMDGGAVGRHAGGLSGFRAPRAKMGYPSMSLTIGCGRHISGPHRTWVEVGSQGVPQTGKIIEVKRRLSGSFFSISEGLAVLFGVAWLGRMSQERW